MTLSYVASVFLQCQFGIRTSEGERVHRRLLKDVCHCYAKFQCGLSEQNVACLWSLTPPRFASDVIYSMWNSFVESGPCYKDKFMGPCVFLTGQIA